MTRLIAFTAAWMFSIWLTQAAVLHPVWALLVVPVGLVLHFGWRERRWTRLTLWALAGLLLGTGRFWLATRPLPAQHVAHFTDQDNVTLVGVVVAAPDDKPYQTNLRVKVERLWFDGEAEGRSVVGKVLVEAPVYTEAQYGDRVRVTGALVTPPVYAGFSYRDVLARRGIHALLEESTVTVLEAHQANRVLELLLRFRGYALARLHRLLPEPQASLLAGILLGVESGIPKPLEKSFSATGTSHIVAISGFNLTLLAGLFVWLARHVTGGRGETAETLVALIGLWLYTALVGSSWAVVRAAIMASVGIFARSKQRPAHAATLLAFAAWAMSALNPHVLWDVGFQLSVAATAGLIFFTDPLAQGGRWLLLRFLSPKRAAWVIAQLEEALFVTLAAQLTTTPIILVTFERLSLVTLLTNFLILPVQPFVMLFGGAALLPALLWLALGRPIGWVAWVFLTYTIEIVRWMGSFPWASVPFRMTGTAALGYYLVLAGVRWSVCAAPRLRARRWAWLRKRTPGQIAGAVGVVAAVALSGYALPDGRLHVHVLDVGRGEALFVQTPAGRQIVIDGGADPARMLDLIGGRLPFWDRTLDLVILTSPTETRVAGLVPLLERYDVAQVAISPGEGDGEHYARWERRMTARAPETVTTLYAGQQWRPERDVVLQVHWPPADAPPGPLVLQIKYRQRSFLLMSDATPQVEEALLAVNPDGLASDVLLLPRHGAATATQAAFLRAVDPDYVVVSLREGQALDLQVQARLLDRPLYRTAHHGTVHLHTAGQGWIVRTERGTR